MNNHPQTSNGVKVVIASDHGGYELKEVLKPFLTLLGYEVLDVGAFALDMNDDYVPFMQVAAKKVAQDPEHTRGIVIGGSGQGEAMAVNRFKGARAAVYYGEPRKNQIDAEGKELDMLTSSREHNNANILSLGARFLSKGEAKEAVKKWLAIPFSKSERHVRRIAMLDEGL